MPGAVLCQNDGVAKNAVTQFSPKTFFFRQKCRCQFWPNWHFDGEFGSKIETKMLIWCQTETPKCTIWAHALSETGSKGHGFASVIEDGSRDNHPIILYYYLWVEIMIQDPIWHPGSRFWPLFWQILIRKMTGFAQNLVRILSVTPVLLVWGVILTGPNFWSILVKIRSQKLTEKDRHIRFLVTSWMGKSRFCRKMSILTKIWM